MTVLFLVEHDNRTLSPATRKALTAAAKLGGVYALVAGEGCAGVAQEAAMLAGVVKVLHADAPHYRDALAEEIAPLIAHVAAQYSYVVAPSGTTGRDVLPRAAALADAPQVSDVVSIPDAQTFVHPIYAGNALETVQVSAAPVFLTVRPTAFAACAQQPAAPVEALLALPPVGLSAFVSREGTATGRPDLGAARVVVSGGRGLGSKEHFAMLERLADRLGGAVGASRAAVDAGYAPNDLQVGQTGRIVAPELYVAVGISGAIQHVAGMKDSRVIVAINKDENAPIFALADYALAGDLFAILPELEKALG